MCAYVAPTGAATACHVMWVLVWFVDWLVVSNFIRLGFHNETRVALAHLAIYDEASIRIGPPLIEMCLLKVHVC